MPGDFFYSESLASTTHRNDTYPAIDHLRTFTLDGLLHFHLFCEAANISDFLIEYRLQIRNERKMRVFLLFASLSLLSMFACRRKSGSGVFPVHSAPIRLLFEYMYLLRSSQFAWSLFRNKNTAGYWGCRPYPGIRILCKASSLFRRPGVQFSTAPKGSQLFLLLCSFIDFLNFIVFVLHAILPAQRI